MPDIDIDLESQFWERGQGLDGTDLLLQDFALGLFSSTGDPRPLSEAIVPVGAPVDGDSEIVLNIEDTYLGQAPVLASAYQRELYNVSVPELQDSNTDLGEPFTEEQHASLEDATLLTSALVGEDGPTGYHTPAIDIDFPVRARQTDTPGHYHLLIDHPMRWEQYKKLLDVMVEVGLVQEGFRDASVKRGASSLRLPWVHKTEITDTAGNTVYLDKDGTPIAHIPDDYDVEYVNGKGVLRLRKESN